MNLYLNLIFIIGADNMSGEIVPIEWSKYYLAATEREDFERGETGGIIYDCVNYDCINDLVDYKFAD